MSIKEGTDIIFREEIAYEKEKVASEKIKPSFCVQRDQNIPPGVSGARKSDGKEVEEVPQAG